MIPTPTETSRARGASNVRLPWETVGAEDAPRVEKRGAERAAAPEEPGEPGGPPPEDAADAEAVDYESPVPAEPLVDELGPPPRGGGWTLGLLCFGIGLVACTV